MPDVIKGTLSPIKGLTGHLASVGSLSGRLVLQSMPEEYHGEVEVTPSASVTTLHTAGYLMPGDITVNPIPSNYGLITWDGLTLTVS